MQQAVSNAGRLRKVKRDAGRVTIGSRLIVKRRHYCPINYLVSLKRNANGVIRGGCAVISEVNNSARQGCYRYGFGTLTRRHVT